MLSNSGDVSDSSIVNRNFRCRGTVRELDTDSLVDSVTTDLARNWVSEKLPAEVGQAFRPDLITESISIVTVRLASLTYPPESDWKA